MIVRIFSRQLQNIRYFSNDYMNNKLLDYLRVKGVVIPNDSNSDALIIQIIQQKEQEISHLSQQITKYKCEDIKNQKLIKTLQDKIVQLAPSISDTGSNFMMASEFKSNFQELMTTLLPSALCSVIDRPYLFSKCVEDVFQMEYHKIEEKIATLTIGVCRLIGLQQNSTQNKELESKIKISLLKILQEHWQKLFPFQTIQNYQYKTSLNQSNEQLVEQLNNLIVGQQYKQMRQFLHKIAVYMVLQDKKWEFAKLNTGQTVQFNKKECVCIDGWIKEGAQSLLVLGGLKRDSHLHANLKNYVIPFQNEENTLQYYKNYRLDKKQIKPKQHCVNKSQIVQKQKEEVHNCKLQELKIQDKQKQVQTSLFMKKKSLQMVKQGKQNNLNYLNKKSKKKDKAKLLLQNSLKDQKSPASRRKQDESLKRSKLKSEQKKELIDQKIGFLKQECFSKKKHSTMVVNKNISNSHQTMFEDIVMLPLKRKVLEDLPVSKEMPMRKKTKPSTSRKNSVGKIVNQHHIINNNDIKDKQNCTSQLNGVKSKNKEKVYKEIIKQKLLEEKQHDKTQNSLTILYPKSRTDRDKKNEENRPLKIQSNASKLREKYIY